MSSEIALRQDAPLTALGQWAVDAGEAYKVASSLSKTTFVPQHFRNKPDEITAAILAGQELGIEPMASLRSIAIISGTPALAAVALRALVQSQGHEVWVKESSATRVVACATRKGSDVEHRSVWTIDRAKQLGLTSRDNWQKQPEAMLVARATSEVCRLVAADAVLGMAYSAEELADTANEPAPKRARRSTPVAATPDAPELEAAEPVEVAPIEVVDAPTLDGGAA